MGVAELGRDLNFPEKPVGGDADQELGVEDLERDLGTVGVPRQKDPRVPAFPDLALHIVASVECLTDEWEHFPRHLMPSRDTPQCSRHGPPRRKMPV